MAKAQRALVRLILFYIFTTAVAKARHHPKLNTQLPELVEGKTCENDKLYRVGCNTCHCYNGIKLICSKMACITPQKHALRIVTYEKKCSPGTFITKGCKRCFCNVYEKLICSEKNCMSARNFPTTHEAISVYSPSEQQYLPSLPHQSAKCTPGGAYRVDCNTCLCLADGNLICGKRLCPSHKDMNRIKAKDMSGKPCNAFSVRQDRCIQCACANQTTSCKAVHNCAPAGSVQQEPLDLGLREINCQPGMIYKQNCNRCTCTKSQSLRCTMKKCLNRELVEYFNDLRKHWDKDNE